jgi:PAS domain S-box-containing protein
MWGYNEDRTDLLYEDWHRIILPADKQKAFDKVEEARINHSFYEVEYRIARADDNAIRWIKSSGLYYYSPSGEAFSLTGISIDITQQKNNEEKIKESEGRFRLLADIMPLQIWTGDENGSLNYFNNAVYEYSGLTYDDLEKDGWLQMVHPDDREENSKRWMYAVTSGEDFFMEHRFKNQSGEYRWQLSRAKPHKNCDGKIILWVGTSTDIHDSKIKEQQKDEFISIASHEMKTPLTTAKGYLELLLLTLNEAETPHLYAIKANQAVQRLHGFVTELLDASKIQNGQLHYNMAAFSFTDLLNETVDNIEHSSTTHTIEKNIQLNSEVTGDRNRLMQVLVNLLNNAVKYSPSANKVLLAAKEDNNELVVSVTDFGIGMAKEHLDKVFDRYYRVQEHSVYFQGLGIGLYISNNIIKRHNGNMWVESEKEKGSTFYFSLPLQKK